MPLTPAQESLLDNWLKKRGDPLYLRRPRVPSELQGEVLDLAPLIPALEPFLETLSKKPVDLPKVKAPGRRQQRQELQWCDDKGFQERYGDPDYYTRIRGLN
jgi:hypothetical protein